MKLSSLFLSLSCMLILSACASTAPSERAEAPISTGTPQEEEPSAANAPQNEAYPFASDAIMQGIALYMREEDIIEVLGEPVERHETEELYFEEPIHVYTLRYDFGEIEIVSPNFLRSVSVTKEGYEGVRGIRVGDEAGDVLRKFTNDRPSQYEEYFYGSPGTPAWSILSGILERDEQGNITEARCLLGGGGYGTTALIIEFVEERVSSITLYKQF